LLVIAPPSGEINPQAFRQDLVELIDIYGDVTLGDLSIGELLRDVLQILSHHRLQFPPDLLQLVKAILTIEGVSRQLDPSFKLAEHVRPYVERVLEERMRPSAIAARVVELGHEAAEVLQTAPRDLLEITRKIRTDGLQIQFVHRNLEHFVQEMNRSSNRLSFAIVIGALIVGSSLILQSNIGPHVFGNSALGLGGFLAAAFVGVQLAIGILRSGRL
jgi:ubiquinone biosynthesis protein